MGLSSPNRSSAAAILLASVWLVVVDNGQYWKLISGVSIGWDRPNPWFLVSIFFVSLTLVNLMLSLLTFGRITRYILSALLLLSAAAASFMDQYGIMLNQGMIQNIFETDRSEAMELINLKLLTDAMVFGVMPAMLIWRLVPTRQSIPGILTEKAIVLGLSFLIITTLVAPFYKDYASLVRNHREIRYLLTPANYLGSIYSYATDRSTQSTVVVPIGEDARKTARWTGVNRHTLTVLVIGETARADNFSLGGYSRNTNPRLADEQIVYFSNVHSCGTSTRVSLPCMFSDLTRADYSRETAKNREGLLDVLNHAGIATLWIDNNSGCKGVCNHTPTRKPVRSTVEGRCVDGKCFDSVLLEELKKVAENIEADTVVVLHQRGSHGPSYYRRYPDEFRQFVPECRSDELSDCTREQIINSYDNTIVYTDFLLSQIIDLLDSYSAKLDTAMLYVSDHGESLGEYGLYLHGAPYFLAPGAQTHVPMMLWLSSGYQQEFRIDRTCLQNRRTETISHDHLFHSILGLLNITTTAYDRKLDIFSGCTLSPMFAAEKTSTPGS